jgi:exodeoxyribonuclease VII small subunit
LAFEECIRQLAEVVDQLERGDLPLEQSVGLFERGMHLARASQAQLEQAEKRVEELLAVTEDGIPVTREIDPR